MIEYVRQNRIFTLLIIAILLGVFYFTNNLIIMVSETKSIKDQVLQLSKRLPKLNFAAAMNLNTSYKKIGLIKTLNSDVSFGSLKDLFDNQARKNSVAIHKIAVEKVIQSHGLSIVNFSIAGKSQETNVLRYIQAMRHRIPTMRIETITFTKQVMPAIKLVNFSVKGQFLSELEQINDG